MYWPTGSASRLAPPSTPSTPSCSPHPELLGIATTPSPIGIGSTEEDVWSPSRSSSPTGLFLDWSATHLTLWNSIPKLALSKLVRTKPCLAKHGLNKLVKLIHHAVVILTENHFLLIYPLAPLPSSDSVYSLPPDHSASFLRQGPALRIPLPKLVLSKPTILPPDSSEDRISCFELSPDFILIGLSQPTPRLKAVPWPSALLPNSQKLPIHPPTLNSLSSFDWLIDRTVSIRSITYSHPLELYILVCSDGTAYVVHRLPVPLPPKTHHVPSEPVHWSGRAFHLPDPVPVPDPDPSGTTTPPAIGPCAVNVRFSLVAIALAHGTVAVYALGHSTAATTLSHTLDLSESLNHPPGLVTGQVNTCAWTSDGHAIAVSWTSGFSVWSVFGRLQAHSTSLPLPDNEGSSSGSVRVKFEDYFMGAGRSLFWGPGDFELVLLTPPPRAGMERLGADEQLFVVPFAKSAVTTLHSPDNTKHAFLQLDDRVWVYRGGDAADSSVLDPGSDNWQHIKLPADYISTNFPIRLSCISPDARLVAVAGTRGFTHYNAGSGRWKLFEQEEEEQAFCVRGGMQWVGNVLVVAVDEGGQYSVRLFGREKPLSMAYCLCEHALASPAVLLSIYAGSVLVYTADNTLHHLLLDGRTLEACGRIGFEGVVGSPGRVRGMSWLIPEEQHCFGDPRGDLACATIIFLIDGKVVLLRPHVTSLEGEVKYRMQVLAERVEFYWVGRQMGKEARSSGWLENSVWGWDGRKIVVWLDALAVEEQGQGDGQDGLNGQEKVAGGSEKEINKVHGNLSIPLSFHPLAVLIDQGIIIGIEHETSIKRSLNFAIFRITTKTELFIHHVVRYYLSLGLMNEAVRFGVHYRGLEYFSHALEVLLHCSLESPVIETRSTNSSTKPIEEEVEKEEKNMIKLSARFIDHFEESLLVVISCARKIEVKDWKRLFNEVDGVGDCRKLFERSVFERLPKVAASYLVVVLGNLKSDDLDSTGGQGGEGGGIGQQGPRVGDEGEGKQQVGEVKQGNGENVKVVENFDQTDFCRVFKLGIQAGEWDLCKELMRFLWSIDGSGKVLNCVLDECGVFDVDDDS